MRKSGKNDGTFAKRGPGSGKDVPSKMGKKGRNDGTFTRRRPGSGKKVPSKMEKRAEMTEHLKGADPDPGRMFRQKDHEP